MKLFSINSVMQNVSLLKPLTILCICFSSSLPITLYAGGGEWYSSFYKENGFNILYDGLLDGMRISRAKGKQTSDSYSDVHYSASAEYSDRDYNLIAWQRFLAKTADEIEAIVYRGELSSDLSTEVSDYLRFVQLQQPLVNPKEVWGETKEERMLRQQKQQDANNQAIATAEAQLKLVKAPFIRQRYVFLMVRLAHYSAQYDKALKLYTRYANDIDKLQNEVAQWTYSLRAGALRHQGKVAEAAYTFAKVFARTRTQKIGAHSDFRIKTDAQWQALMTMCKNNEEKALMHYMRGTKVNANSLQELQQVYQLTPNSSWINSLLLRELEFVQFARSSDISIYQQILIDDVNRYEWKKSQLSPQKIARRTAYIAELSNIIDRIKTDNKRQDLFLVDYAALYLRLLSQKPIVVADVEAFQQQYAHTKRTEYTTGLAYFVYLENLDTIDEVREQRISSYLEKIKQQIGKKNWEYSSDVIDYTYIKLTPLYVKTKQRGKAYIAKNKGYIDVDKILVGEIRALKALSKQNNPNLLTQQMTQALQSMLTEGKPVAEIIARKYLAAGLFEQAKEKLQTLSEDKPWTTAYNPFTTSKSGNNRIKSTPKNLLAFAETMLTLEKQVTATPDDATAHFLLATAYYNMTWFGNSPMILRYHRSTYQWNEGETDLSKAKKHYALALQYADDRELKVKTLYALAKIEENEVGIKLDTENNGRWPRGYNSDDYQATSNLKQKQGVGKYFKKIQAYKDTVYFDEVIKQCADYKLYSQR